MGYHADLAENGREAVAKQEAAPYDVILLDVQMPEMDGIEALHAIRAKFDKGRPFLIALTANALQGDQERFLKEGFDAYLSKPLKPERLQDMLRVVSAGRMG
jgi:CheY-like chemotaxis protein